MSLIKKDICFHCDNILDDFIKFKLVDVNNQFKYFCSEECCRHFIESKGIDKYEIFEVSRCPGFYDCQEIGNLRGICEDEKSIEDYLTPPSIGLLSNPSIKLNFNKWCEPSEVSIIKSHVKLYRFMEDSERRASELNEKTLKLNQYMQKLTEDTLKHTKCMTYLTVAMLIVTIINLFLFFR